MSAYYNENDPKVVEWLRCLVVEGHLPEGRIDSRSIRDLSGFDAVRIKGPAHFFAGIGGWPLALRLAGVPDDAPIWTGSCPCFPSGTLVMTDKGQVPIESVQVGDWVLTHRHRFRRVAAVGSNDNSACISVRGQGHPGIRCTPAHPFLTRDGWVAAKDLAGLRWATVGEVPAMSPPKLQVPAGVVFDDSVKAWRAIGERDGKRVYLGVFDTRDAAIVARSSAVREKRVDVRGADAADICSVEFAKWLGYWVGDGWCTGNQVTICAAKHESDLLRDLCSKARLSVCLSEERTTVRGRTGSASLAAWLLEHFGSGAHAKRIPTWLHGMPTDYRDAFLDGYALADGHYEKSARSSQVRRFTTTSLALAVGVRILLNQKQVSASVTYHKPNRKLKIEGRVVAERGFYRVTEYQRTRSFTFSSGHGWGIVRDIRSAGASRVFNIAVEEDESYVAEGLVVHNCQPFSQAGRGRGEKDDRHLWPEWRRLIAVRRPAAIFGEQVASPDGRTWLFSVRADLEALGYVVGAADLCAAGIGAPHLRQRLFFVAYLPGNRRHEGCSYQDGRASRTASEEERRRPSNHGSALGMALSDGERREGERVQLRCRVGNTSSSRGRRHAGAVPREEAEGHRRRQAARTEPHEPHPAGEVDLWRDVEWIPCGDGKLRPVEPGTAPVAHGVPGRVVKLRAYGNAIVPALAAEFVRAALEAVDL